MATAGLSFNGIAALACDRSIITSIQAALLEFLTAATGARIVAANVLEWIHGRRAGRPLRVAIGRRALPAFFAIRVECCPCRQFVDGVAEQAIFVRIP